MVEISYPHVCVTNGQVIRIIDGRLDHEPDEHRAIQRTRDYIDEGEILLVSNVNGGLTRYAQINPPHHVVSIYCVPFN